jgi:plasmid maintenance system antidote protein VapI
MKDSPPELKSLQEFICKKKIKFKNLAKEMGYTPNHVSKIFNGRKPVTSQFKERLIKSVQKMLLKEIEEFEVIIRELEWTRFLY